MLIFCISLATYALIIENYYSPNGNTCLQLRLLQQDLPIYTFTLATAITIDHITDGFQNSADFIA
jgi:hypothetical protein